MIATDGHHLNITDPRSRSNLLRLSWHPAKRVVILSQWRDGVCIATTPLEIARVTDIAGFLVKVLHDAATQSIPATDNPSQGNRLGRIWQWLHPRLAPVVAIARARMNRAA